MNFGDVSLVLVVLALTPGWIYRQLTERLRPPSTATGLAGVIEMFAAGLITTVAAAGILLLAIPHQWLPFLLDVDAVASQGPSYLRSHIRGAAVTAAIILLLAVAIAYGIYLVRRIRQPAEFRNQVTVWGQALGTRPRGTAPYVGLQLKDGPLIQGQLHCFSLGQDPPESRDIALMGPLWTSGADQIAHPLPVDRFVISGDRIDYITVRHIPVVRPRKSGALMSRVAARLKRSQPRAGASIPTQAGASAPAAGSASPEAIQTSPTPPRVASTTSSATSPRLPDCDIPPRSGTAKTVPLELNRAEF